VNAQDSFDRCDAVHAGETSVVAHPVEDAAEILDPLVDGAEPCNTVAVSLLDESVRPAVPMEVASPTEDACTAGSSVAPSASSEKASRYTAGLLSLLLRAYAKRGRPPPDICSCVPRPTGSAPTVGPDGSLDQLPAWDSWARKMANASSHARNCEFATSLPKLQRHVLVLIRDAKLS